MAPTKNLPITHFLSLIHEHLICRLDHTYRFNGTPLTLPRESVSQHSFWVAFFTNLIIRELFNNAARAGEIPRARYLEMLSFALQQAIMHDVEEIYTGDITFGTKYHPAVKDNGVKANLHNIVLHEIATRPDDAFKRAMNDTLTSNSPLTPEEKGIMHAVVKLADWLSAYKTAYEENLAANVLGEFKKVLGITRNGIAECLKDIHQSLNLIGISYNETFFTLMYRELDEN